ncbi:MAG: ABC transporter permease subunit [Leptolyngbya sp. Prado105]|nr:ABC transporter permease subunit [Leptolyngbya sp. Prado105]
MKWRSIALACICTLFVVLNPMRSLSQQTLTVAVEPVYAPFEFRDQSGEIQGFDIDLIREIGKVAGFGVRFQNIAFDGIIPSLQARTVDAAVGAMTITPARSQVVDFSRPYFKAGLAIASQTNQPINALEELNGRAIAVQIGTTGAQAAQKIPNAQIRTFDAAVLALQELRNGNVVAVIHDAPILQYALKTGNLRDIQVSEQLLTEDYLGIPTPKGSPNLARINQGLGTILDNGTYRNLYRKWFNAEPPALPETVPNATANQDESNWFTTIARALPVLLAGALVTIQLAVLSITIGLVAGSLIGIARLSKIKPIRWLARAYVDFFRGTPLLVQIFMIYFGIPAVIQELGLEFSFNRFVAAVVALSLNSAAYIAEIVRAGIVSIEVGQTEAAESLGLDSTQVLRHVIFPQAFRRMLPPLGNTFISLLKDTTLVAVIGFEELFRQGQLIVAANYRPFELYAIVALIYLVLTLLSSQLFSYLERRMNPVQRVRNRDRAVVST